MTGHPHTASAPTDVCLLVEGCYPYVPGGVSSWIDWLIRSAPDTTFSVVSLWPKPAGQAPRYQRPDNLVRFEHLYLQDFGAAPRGDITAPPGIDALAASLSRFVTRGGTGPLRDVMARLSETRRHVSLPVLFNSPIAWQLVERMYALEMPYGSFLHYFWAWRALLGGLFATLEHPLPEARVYHAISTGYAGLLAARARIETGKPALLTEHGIYTNERRIELLMADWVADTIDKGHRVDDPRVDLRDLWVGAFEAYARTCYAAADTIVTLYGDNQRLQRALGAEPNKLKIIANGIDPARFLNLAPRPVKKRPTIALIGRVVPIKDVKTFITAAGLLAKSVPDVHALILGPLDEDPVYANECQELVESLGLADTVTFTGQVDVKAYLPSVDVCVLTSLSESQPLVLLEAGAAAIPFVATNVGSCREIIEGAAGETPPLGSGGIVTNLVAPHEIADACARLLADEALRHEFGQTLRRRVTKDYTSEQAASSYRDLYARLIGPPHAGAALDEVA